MNEGQNDCDQCIFYSLQLFQIVRYCKGATVVGLWQTNVLVSTKKHENKVDSVHLAGLKMYC